MVVVGGVAVSYRSVAVRFNRCCPIRLRCRPSVHAGNTYIYICIYIQAICICIYMNMNIDIHILATHEYFLCGYVEGAVHGRSRRLRWSGGCLGGSGLGNRRVQVQQVLSNTFQTPLKLSNVVRTSFFVHRQYPFTHGCCFCGRVEGALERAIHHQHGRSRRLRWSGGCFGGSGLAKRCDEVQQVTHKKVPSPLGPPEGPRHRPTVGP